MRILVCGSRNWTDKNYIQKQLSEYDQNTVIITGGAKGADTLAHRIAKSLEMKTEVYPAEWSIYGKSAGPIRNQKMLDRGKPDLVLAFHENLSESKGTADMIKRVHKMSIPLFLFTKI